MCSRFVAPLPKLSSLSLVLKWSHLMVAGALYIPIYSLSIRFHSAWFALRPTVSFFLFFASVVWCDAKIAESMTATVAV